MYRLLRPLLFALPPETAHALALAALRVYGASPKGARRGSSSKDHSPAVRRSDGAVPLLGLSFANRVGLAAGLDKDATAVAGLARLGFGFLEVGTVTPKPQAGNPKPRLFRLREDAALVNRMGFNSAGMEIVAKNLAAARRHVAVPIGVNIGKNRDTPLAAAAENYAKCLAAVHDVADYIAVNLSSPNTPGLRDLQAATKVRALIETLVAERGRLSAAKHSLPKPLLVKVAPDLEAADLVACATAALEAGADGIIAVNSTVTRPPTLRSRHAAQAGGLSGPPLLPMALQTVRRVRDCIGDDAALIAVGGVSNAADVRAMLDAGANLVQVYSALIYRGPGCVRTLARETGPCGRTAGGGG